MNTFSSIIDTLGGGAVVARAIGEDNAGTVRQWKRRDSIPADRWPKIVQFADEQGKNSITYERLAKLAARETKPASKRRKVSA
jgi:hypothetical protein